MLSNLKWLLKMIQENPTLPVIPIVSDEVIDTESDSKLIGSNRWMGSIGNAEILMYIRGKDGIRLYGDCSYIDTLVNCGKYTKEQCKQLTEEQIETEYDNLPWENAIFVNIDWVEE